MPAPNNNHSPADAERSGTILETDDDMRQALLSGLKNQQPVAVAMPRTVIEPPRVAPPAPPVPSEASPFRPMVRPAVPILTVFDDGKAEGETIRVRDPKLLIGRSEGQLQFPLDGRMSARHVEITLQSLGGKNRWVITDLQSTHGLFVRVSKVALADKAEILVGNGRYRFEANQPDPAVMAEGLAEASASGQTQGWSEGPGPFRPPALTELIGSEIGNRVLLVRDEYWIGTDPSCPIQRADDPFCEPRHARLSRNSKGGWGAEHNKTQNGLWLRMTQITVDTVVHFQVGEQRFRLKM